MSNKEIAEMIRHVAAAYILKDEAKYRFQIIAYQKAADSIEREIRDLKGLWQENKLGEIDGIGKTIAGYLVELFTTGKVVHFETLFKSIPPPVFSLMKIPGMGPKRASKLVKALDLDLSEDPIADLKDYAHQHKIAAIEGFGDKSEAEIIKNIEAYTKGETKENRLILPLAFEIAQDVIGYLKKEPAVLQIESLGSLRRMAATIHDIDIAVASDEPQIVLDYFVKYPQTGRIIEKGENTSSIVTKTGVQIDLMIQSPSGFGALLQHFTGSKGHNIRLRELAIKQGLSLSEYGIKTKNKNYDLRFKNYEYNKKLNVYQFPTEELFYDALGLLWIPPELREDRGEVEAGFKNKLPNLVDLQDIKGDLHVHSDFDLESSHDLGVSPLSSLLDKAEDLNYEYLGLSDHNPSISKHNDAEIEEILKKRKEYIEQKYTSWKRNHEKSTLKVLNSLEVDILVEGKLALSDKNLELLDFCIASVHSSFTGEKESMTKRILTGLNHPKVKIFGHPTGRILNQREGINADWEKIFTFCKEKEIALEVNGYPTRLDLPDSLVKEAVKMGVKIIINTDSHAVEQMDLMFYGVEVARRGWAEAGDILNTLSYNEFCKWIIK